MKVKKILKEKEAVPLGLKLLVFSLFALADNPSGPMGPNPLAGDGVPDGSILDSPNGPNGDINNDLTDSSIAGTDEEDVSGPLGPNPDAGDGIPDGSSLDSPNGPNGDAKPK